MSIESVLENQGWELVQRDAWIAVQDHRPAFNAAFSTKRVGKIVESKFFVTLNLLSTTTQGIIREIGQEPISIKSRNKDRDVTYWGFDTGDVSEKILADFANKLANAIDDMINL